MSSGKSCSDLFAVVLLRTFTPSWRIISSVIVCLRQASFSLLIVLDIAFYFQEGSSIIRLMVIGFCERRRQSFNYMGLFISFVHDTRTSSLMVFVRWCCATFFLNIFFFFKFLRLKFIGSEIKLISLKKL